MPQTILKLKLVDPPIDELEHVAKLCRQGANAAVEDWLLRLRKKRRRSKKQMGRAGKGLHPSTELYHAVTAAVPELGTTPATSIAQSVWSNLNAKIDWRERVAEEQRSRKRMDAIFDYEARPPFTTGMQIPCANKHTTFAFGDDLSVTIHGLLRDSPPMTLLISCKGAAGGHKKRIRGIIAGDIKLSDSFLTRKTIRNGQEAWFFFLVSQQNAPVRFYEERQVILSPHIGEGDRPFRLDLPNDRVWRVGDGRYLHAQSERLLGLRKMIGYRYKYGNGTGHGRKKVDRAVRLRNQQLRNVRDEFRRRLIDDIVKQCIRHQAGTLVYREPTEPVKNKTWFADMGLEFDWTRFKTDLKNTAARRGVMVETDKLKIKEVLDHAKAVAAV